jgi:hypothetical protein
MYVNRGIGGGAAGVLAVTGLTAPLAALVIVGTIAVAVGVLVLWRAYRLRVQTPSPHRSVEGPTPR